ncbi:MAG: helix-turn-helix domain-containing protein [Verrucomicrobiia bacterium]
MEKRVIVKTLAHCGNNKSEAARVLGIAEKSIYNKIKKYGLAQ